MIIVPLVNTNPQRRKSADEVKGMITGRGVALGGMALGALQKDAFGNMRIKNMFQDYADYFSRSMTKTPNKKLGAFLSAGTIALGAISTICVCEFVGEKLGQLKNFIKNKTAKQACDCEECQNPQSAVLQKQMRQISRGMHQGRS